MTLTFINPTDSDAIRLFCDSIRYLISLTITDEDLPNELILRDYYFDSSSSEIAMMLYFSDQQTYDALTPEQQSKITTALQYRLISKLLGDLPDLISEEKLEKLEYADWDLEEMKRIYLILIERDLWEFQNMNPQEEGVGLSLKDYLEPLLEAEPEVEEYSYFAQV